MDWKAECGQINLAHVAKNKNDTLDRRVLKTQVPDTVKFEIL